MTQLSALTPDEQALAQFEFEQYVAQQATIITSEKNANCSLIQSFLSGDEPNTPVPSLSDLQTPGRESLKHLLIGSHKAVISTIHYLQVIGYADVGDWSPLARTPNSGEVVSILIRNIIVQ